VHGSRERQSGSTRTGRNRKFRFRNDTTSCYHASKLVDMRPVPWQTTIVRYRKRLCFRSVVEKSCKENDLQRQSLTSPPKRRRTTPATSAANVISASHHRQNDGGLRQCLRGHWKTFLHLPQRAAESASEKTGKQFWPLRSIDHGRQPVWWRRLPSRRAVSRNRRVNGPGVSTDTLAHR